MWTIISLILCLVLAPGLSSAEQSRSDRRATEEQLTAAFLYHFAQFVEWPADAHPSTFVIGVYADDELVTALDRLVAGKDLEGCPFEVRRLTSPDGIVHCQIAFLGGSDPCLLDGLLAQAIHDHVLTVARSPEFAQHGGVINLVPVGRHLRFEINPGAARRAGLRVSSKLLSLATLVADPRN